MAAAAVRSVPVAVVLPVINAPAQPCVVRRPVVQECDGFVHLPAAMHGAKGNARTECVATASRSKPSG